ncbi:galactokinase [Tenacibaculum agarivorans]|uniref:galactokinase n=1 Tax=Tenacibaculum agarivorans TaxID=1908389 RepID=UPI000AB28516|nr:galactokinase [Tenacibaculum agarivorans]
METLNKDYFEDFETELTVFSPGRINLIGEHTDYNDGFVLPTAIDKKISLSFKKNNTAETCNIYSKNFDAFLQFQLSKIEPSTTEWENYILGVIHEFQKRNAPITGFDCVIHSELPIGAGISSSAALECGTAIGVNSLFNLQFSSEDLITFSRDAEHNFVGTKCGVMDQFAVVMSEKDHLLLLDCKTLAYELIPFNFSPYKLLLINTNISHNLASSEYNKRREECELGVKIIQQNYPEVTSLRDVNLDMLNSLKPDLDETIYRRCKYVISENNRVKQTVKNLKESNLNLVGELMYASHEGLRNSYDVSCPELDFLVDFSKSYELILGARMMGGGFGGCTIHLIHQDFINEYTEIVSAAYQKQFGINATVIEVNPCQGSYIKI